MAKTRARNAAPRGRRWTPKKAKRVLEEQVKSGLTVSAFAAREKLNVYRLYRWQKRLCASAPKPPTFEELVVRDVTQSPTEPAVPTRDRIEVVLRSGLIVRVGESFNAETLRRLLGVLEGARSC